MSALISDIVDERIDNETAQSICNAGGKLLKVVEMQQKYGAPTPRAADGSLALVESQDGLTP